MMIIKSTSLIIYPIARGNLVFIFFGWFNFYIILRLKRKWKKGKRQFKRKGYESIVKRYT